MRLAAPPKSRARRAADTRPEAACDRPAARVATPEDFHELHDRRLHHWRGLHHRGALGVSQKTPLARMYTSTRTLRLADGPDEVHHMVVGRNEVRQYREMPHDPSTAAVFRN